MIASLVLIWGVSWPVYKIALNYTPPVLFAGMRCLLGGLLLLLVALPRYRQLRFRRTWFIYVISGLLNAVLFFGLQTIGLQYLPAGLFSVVVYLQPVLVGVFAWLWLGEGMSLLKVFGLVLGFMGVIAISLESLSGRISGVGLLLALASATSWALGTVYTKRIGPAVDSVWLVAGQFFFGGLVTVVLGAGMENLSAIDWSSAAYLVSLAYGGVFGVAIAWLLYFALVRAGEASKVASFTFMVPLISVLIGTLFLHEPFTSYLLAGIVCIAVSIYLVNRPVRKRTTSEEIQAGLTR